MPPAFTLDQVFPVPTRPPQLLLDFLAWHASTDSALLGNFELLPSRLDDFWIEQGSDLAANFTLFVRLRDGSMVGFWYPDGPASPTAPLVLLGSEGQTEILADNLEGLLARIALGAFNSEGPLGSFLPVDSPATASGLTDWLRTRLWREDLAALTPIRGTYPDLQGWLDAWQEEQLAAMRVDPHLNRLGELLASYFPPSDQTWRTTNFRVAMVGTRYEAWHLRAGPQPFPEAAALEEVLRDVRAARVTRLPERGAWFSVTVRLSADGLVNVVADFEGEPDFQGAPPTAEDYAADLRAFPRSPAWMPGWLAEHGEA